MKELNILMTSSLVLASMGSTFALDEIYVNDSTYEMMKTGFDSERQDFRGVCVEQEDYTDFQPGTGKSTFNLEQSLDEGRVASELGIHAGTKFMTGATKYSVEADFVKNSSSSSFSITSTYSASYDYEPHILDLGKTKFNSNAQAVLGNEDIFREVCGDQFIYKQVYGAKLFFTIRIDFDSQQSKDEFAARFSMKGPATSVTASLEKAKNEFSKKTKVTVSAFQTGGDISKITEIINGKNRVGDASGYAFKECSFGNLTECETVLQDAISYATDTATGFPSQLEKGKFGPVLRKQMFKDYRVLEGFPRISPQLTLVNKRAMNKLNSQFLELLEQDSTLESLSKGIVRLSPRQTEKFTELQDVIDTKVSTIVEAINDCYLNLSTCDGNYNLVKEETRPLSNDDFLIEKEVFSQVCDYAKYYGDVSENETVEAIIADAKKQDPSQFKPLTDDEVIDECEVTERIITKSKSIDLSHRNLSDYSPLKYFSNLKSLSIRDADLLDISFLEEIPSLTYLDLSNNWIRDIDGLVHLKSLVTLLISNNKIKDATVLNNLPMIMTVEIMNNSSSVICPSHIPNCVSHDYSNYVEVSPKYRDSSLPYRSFHTAVAVDDSVLIFGGAAGGQFHKTKIEVMNNYEDFTVVGNLKYSHDFATSHLVNDKVLVIGGVDIDSNAELVTFDGVEAVAKFIPMVQTRFGHTSVQLKNGDILVTGGHAPHSGTWSDANLLSSAELFSHETQEFIRLPNMNSARSGHSMTLLENGNVLIVGGFNKDVGSYSAELYNTTMQTFEKLEGKLFIPRGFHSAHLLENGSILFVGGYTQNGVATKIVELYDPKADEFLEQSFQLDKARGEHHAFSINDGLILLIGGTTRFDGVSRKTLECKAATDDDGEGLNNLEQACLISMEILDIETGRSALIKTEQQLPRIGASATLFDGDKILILGGNKEGYDYNRASILNF